MPKTSGNSIGCARPFAIGKDLVIGHESVDMVIPDSLLSPQTAASIDCLWMNVVIEGSAFVFSFGGAPSWFIKLGLV